MYQLDTNVINARQKLSSMNLLEKWANDGVILIDMSEVAQNEASSGSCITRKYKAQSHIYTSTKITTPDELTMFSKIEKVVFPDGVKNQNESNDVEIIFNAWKYGRTLISNDGGSRRQPEGILGHKNELKRLGINVINDTEAVKEVQMLIQNRDNMAQLISQKTGKSLPVWVGKD